MLEAEIGFRSSLKAKVEQKAKQFGDGGCNGVVLLHDDDLFVVSAPQFVKGAIAVIEASFSRGDGEPKEADSFVTEMGNTDGEMEADEGGNEDSIAPATLPLARRKCNGV